MFRGVSTVSLDSKGRLVIPARYRDTLLATAGGQVIVTADRSRCLLLYPLPEWEPIEKRLTELSGFHPQIRAMQRLLIGHAHELDMDAAGRILLPPMLRKFAGLEKNVVLVGQGVKLEMWNEERWQNEVDQALAFNDGQMPPELEGFTL